MKTFASAVSLVAALSLLGQSAVAATLGSPPPTLATITNVPAPAASPISPGDTLSALRFGPNGQLYDSSGTTVSEQTGGLTGSFTSIGSVPTTGSDPGPLNFSSDGQTILVSNGGGGDGPSSANGVLYSQSLPVGLTGPASPLPTAGKVGTVQYNYDFVPTPISSTFATPSRSFLVDVGNSSYSASEVDLFNSSTGGDTPVITGIPGASSSLAITGTSSSNYQLLVGVGSGNSQGEIEEFSLSAVATAAKNNSPLTWSAGTVVNPGDTSNNSGLGMFVDPRGYIFAGGPNSIEMITPNQGSYTYSIPYDTSGDLLSYSTVTYNAITNQLVVQGYNSSGSTPVSQAIVYSVLEFTTANLLGWTGLTNYVWDVGNTNNWSNSGTTSQFNQADTVMFGDKNPDNGALVPNTNHKVTITIAAGGVQPAAVIFTNTGSANSGIDYTLSGGPIGGSATLELYGNGTLGGIVTLTGANTFAGATIVAAGTLNLQNSQALGNSSGVNVIAGTGLQLQSSSGTPTFGLTATGSKSIPLNLYGTGLTSTSAATAPGELYNISGSNTYGGAVDVDTGGGQIISASSSGGSQLTVSGGVNISAGSTLSLVGPGNTTISGAGLSIGNSGSLRVQSGTTRVSFTSGTGTVSLGTGTSATIASGATLQLAGTLSVFSDSTSGNSLNITNNSSVASTGLVVVSGKQTVGAVTGTGTTNGKITTYSGNTTVDAGASLTATQILGNTLVVQAGGSVTIVPTATTHGADETAPSGVSAVTSDAVSTDSVALQSTSASAANSDTSALLAAAEAEAATDPGLTQSIERMENRVTALSRLAAENPIYEANLSTAENMLDSLESVAATDGFNFSDSLLFSAPSVEAGATAVPEPTALSLLLVGLGIAALACGAGRMRLI